MNDQELADLERRLELAATGANIHTALKAKCYLRGRRDDPIFIDFVTRALNDPSGGWWKVLDGRMRRWF